MSRYRVFVSYSSKDQEIVDRLVGLLRLGDLEPLWAGRLGGGGRFVEEIQCLIRRSHVFMPLLTKRSIKSQWVQAEIGFAVAWNIPIIPICIGVRPDHIIRDRHAIVTDDTLGNFADEIERADIPGKISDNDICSRAWFESAYDSLTRTSLIVKYAEDARRYQKGESRVRIRGAYSSFAIPDCHPKDRRFDERESFKGKYSEEHRYWLRRERQILERHARAAGCDLLIDPTFTFDTKAEAHCIARLKTVLEFIESMPDDKLRVVIDRIATKENLLLVGDWFMAQSLVLTSKEGLKQTIFTWHAPRVLHEIAKFDDLFGALGGHQPGSRQRAIDILRSAL